MTRRSLLASLAGIPTAAQAKPPVKRLTVNYPSPYWDAVRNNPVVIPASLFSLQAEQNRLIAASLIFT